MELATMVLTSYRNYCELGGQCTPAFMVTWRSRVSLFCAHKKSKMAIYGLLFRRDIFRFTYGHVTCRIVSDSQTHIYTGFDISTIICFTKRRGINVLVIWLTIRKAFPSQIIQHYKYLQEIIIRRRFWLVHCTSGLKDDISTKT